MDFAGLQSEIKTKVFTKTGKINAAYVKTDAFKESVLCKKIYDATGNISTELPLRCRITLLLEGRTEMPVCPVCMTRPLKWHEPGGYTKTCGCSECIKHRMATKHVVAGPRQKNINDRHNLIELYREGRFKILESLEFMEPYIEDLKANKNIHSKLIKDVDAVCTIIEKTKFIALDESDLKLSERLYCIQNNIKELRTCPQCGGAVAYINVNEGYRKVCPNCAGGQSCKARIKNHTSKVFDDIKSKGFEIENSAEISEVGINKAPFKLVCEHGHKFTRALNNGRWEQDIICPECNPYVSSSREEEQVYDWLRSVYSGEIIRHYTDIFPAHQVNGSRKELDIYLPGKKLAIEYNGIYYHHSNGSLHKHKSDVCDLNGINLIHIFSNDWRDRNKNDILKSMIHNKLGLPRQKLYARDCELSEITHAEASPFFDANHLQGSDKSSVRYGLFHENEMVAAMSFSCARFDETHEWELVRYACKKYTFIMGAASKLFTAFLRNYNPSTIVSYANRSHSSGGLYKTLKFVHTHNSTPNYTYVKSNGHTVSRYQAQKHKLSKLLGDKFNPDLSEAANMHAAGYKKIEDAGNMVFVWRAPK